MKYMKYCSRCVLPDTHETIKFDEEGVKKGSLETKKGHFLIQRLISGEF